MDYNFDHLSTEALISKTRVCCGNCKRWRQYTCPREVPTTDRPLNGPYYNDVPCHKHLTTDRLDAIMQEITMRKLTENL